MESVQEAKSLLCLFGDISAVSLYSSEILGCVDLNIYGGKRSNIYSRLKAKALWAGWTVMLRVGYVLVKMAVCVCVCLTGLNG